MTPTPDPVDEGLTDEQRAELADGGYSDVEIEHLDREAGREAALPPIHEDET